jgi:hypothetical protein
VHDVPLGSEALGELQEPWGLPLRVVEHQHFSHRSTPFVFDTTRGLRERWGS